MELLKTKKEDYDEVSKRLTNDDISFLIKSFNTKERCVAFSILSLRSENFCDVYPYWTTFVKLLKSNNAFEKSIGLKLISINTKWDKDKFDIKQYLQLCNDDSLVVTRACIQGLKDILINKKFDKNLCNEIEKFFSSYDIKKRPQTNWNVLKKDISSIIGLILNH